MKTQLLQDIDESRPGAVVPPAPKAKPAVWSFKPPPQPPAVQASAPPASQPDTPEPPFAFAFDAAAPPGVEAPVLPEAGPINRWSRYGPVAALLVVLLGVAGAGMWMHRERQIDNTMAVLATNLPPQQRTPRAKAPVPPAVVAPVAVAAPAASPLPPSEPGTEAQPVSLPVTAVAPKADIRPAAKRARTAGRAAAMEDTLRACRAMGYHASKCVERGCFANKYGLVCKK